jgi:hypothetical protein
MKIVSMTIKAVPQYLVTVTPKGKKKKEVIGVRGLTDIENPTPMDILLRLKETGATVHNFRVVPDCPAVIVLSWQDGG